MIAIRKLAIATLSLAFIASIHARGPQEIQPLLIGASVPKATLRDQSGTEQYLPALLQGKSTVLVFYRGGWCPYCNKQLQGLGAAEADLLAMGYQIIAISPDSPERLSTIEKDGPLNYTLLSDADLAVAHAFGIDYTLDKETQAKYANFGIDLAAASGGLNKDKLPVPSVFLITPDNVVSFNYIDPDYRFRLSTDLLLAAAKDRKRFHQK